MKEVRMRLRVLAAIVAALGALWLVAGCGSSAAPVSTYSSYAEDAAPPQSAIPDSCLRMVDGVRCSPGHIVLGLEVGTEHFTEGPLTGMTIVTKANANGTYTVEWSTTNPQMQVVGATDAGWMNNGEDTDVVQSPSYTSKAGETEFALHVDTPGVSIWDQVKPSPTS